MIKAIGLGLVGAAVLMASPVFAGGAGCCGSKASNEKKECTDFASLGVTADQKTKLEAWQADCMKAGCTKESKAKFLKQAKGILSPEQYAKVKAECAGNEKKQS
jgi:hypothetical protein